MNSRASRSSEEAKKQEEEEAEEAKDCVTQVQQPKLLDNLHLVRACLALRGSICYDDRQGGFWFSSGE